MGVLCLYRSCLVDMFVYVHVSCVYDCVSCMYVCMYVHVYIMTRYMQYIDCIRHLHSNGKQRYMQCSHYGSNFEDRAARMCILQA